jgi:hypothetical protein
MCVAEAETAEKRPHDLRNKKCYLGPANRKAISTSACLKGSHNQIIAANRRSTLCKPVLRLEKLIVLRQGADSPRTACKRVRRDDEEANDGQQQGGA